jgi:hypothetical protein
MRRLAPGELRAGSVAFAAACGAGIACLAAIACCVLFASQRSPSDVAPGEGAIAELTALTAYSVRVDGEEAKLDLEFTPNSRYLVVVGSLGSAHSRYGVSCSATRVPRVQIAPLQRVTDLCDGSHPAAQQRVALKPVSIDVIAAKIAATAPTKSLKSRTFSLHVTDGTLDDPAQYVTVHANAIAEGREVRVYLDDQQSAGSLPPGLVPALIEQFDGEIVPKFRGLLGTYRDVDHDGRFAILLSPWLGRLQGGRTSVGGFVRGSDFQSCLGRPFSNRCDMMYINSQTQPGAHLRTLLIHEYTHAVCFSRRTPASSGLPQFPDEEDWLNEAIAHCAESLFGGGWSNLDYRIARFLEEPSAYPLVVTDYYRAGLWRCHGCRGATYLFLRFCVEQFSPQMLSRLISDPARGTQNLELATGHSFEDIFRAWTLWLAEAGWQKPAAAARNPVETAASPELASLDLYGSLGDWGFAGPQTQFWNVDAEHKDLELRGTSAAFLELSAGESPGPRRICLKGASGSRLLVSVVRLDDNDRPIKIDAALETVPVAAKSVGTSDKFVRVVVRSPEGPDLTVEQISAEQNVGETHASVCFANAELRKAESPAPKTSINPSRTTTHAYLLPVPRLSDGKVPIVVSLVAADRNGRRTSARAIVQPQALPHTEHLAQHTP